MDKLNLWDIEDEDIEFFLDTIHENTILDGELLPPSQKQDFGNHCSIEALSHEVLSVDEENNTEQIRSHLLLHMQAETDIKIEIVWERIKWDDDEDEFGFEEAYFESKEGPYEEDGPNYDPRNSPYWEEFLDDLEG
tara:strand:+ start:136 stop:543 length:408 start_codon:yes stop_codon:yes gene_type:complete